MDDCCCVMSVLKKGAVEGEFFFSNILFRIEASRSPPLPLLSTVLTLPRAKPPLPCLQKNREKRIQGGAAALSSRMSLGMFWGVSAIHTFPPENNRKSVPPTP